MIEPMTSMAAAISGGIVKVATRSASVLIKSGLAWLVVLSIYRQQTPAEVLQSAVDWSGAELSLTPVVDWVHTRGSVIEAFALFVLSVSISGVRFGSTSWTSTHGPMGMSLGVILLVETGAPNIALVVAMTAGPLFATALERDIGSGAVVFVSPWIYLIAPAVVLSDLLGFRGAASKQRSHHQARLDRTGPAASRAARVGGEGFLGSPVDV
ncbi:hypothetical protein [Kribbella koreensis]